MPGIEPGASYMQSMRSTTELHPLYMWYNDEKRNAEKLSISTTYLARKSSKWIECICVCLYGLDNVEHMWTTNL